MTFQIGHGANRFQNIHIDTRGTQHTARRNKQAADQAVRPTGIRGRKPSGPKAK